MKRTVRFALVAVLFAAFAAAQDDESEFNLKQAQKLNAFAKKAFDKGFPRQAKLIWLQVLKLYDPDNVDAHKAIGHVKVGQSWGPDPKFVYPTADTGTGSEGTALFKGYETLQKELAAGHRAQAEKWAAAGRTDKSNQHWKMVLRWVSDDKKAQAALEYREIGGLSGTALEQTLYENSKKLEKAITEQQKMDYPVQKSTDAKCAVLDKAQVPYVTVTSENFTLHGDEAEEPNLIEALRWAERTLKVCAVAFQWETKPDQMLREWAFFTSKETYQQILKANADKLKDLAWLLENSSTSQIGGVEVGATGSVQVLLDAAVRNVAHGYARFATAGFNEGIGHTFVGMMFNNNRLFAVDRKRQQGTVASEEDREYQSPDFDVWKTLNLEMAWKNTGGVPARELPFCDAASFTNEQRIKAWSFCDYVMRRDPQMLRDMDQLGAKMKSEGKKQPLDLAAQFDSSHEVKLAQLEKEWEDFWTEASPTLKAIQNNTAPLAAVSKGVEKWLEALNAARKTCGGSPVTWSSNLSTRCHDHAEYLKANKTERGITKEHTESIELGGTRLGAMFAEMAIVDASAKIGDAKKMFQGWLAIPGYRDALVHDFLLTTGIYSDGDILVMNVVSGLGSPKSKSGGYTSYPTPHLQGVPTQVEVAEIGPELVAMLEKQGKGSLKVVGFPLTLHFGPSGIGNRLSYSCKVIGARNEEIKGAMLFDDGKIRRSSAPGMVTFYPFEPLPHGDVVAQWTWEHGNGEQNKLKVDFKTK
ncbi:MAG: CAP domain-containing protein [Planctomycetota bacterium]|nr:CAP domain-containing protein [Planctomycetota bacterium]